MAGEATQGGSGAGAGTAGQGGQSSGTSTGGAGAPNAQQGAGAGGSPAAGTGTPTPQSVPLDVLPEALRSRSPQEVKLILNNLVTGVQSQRSELEQLRTQLRQLQEQGGTGGQSKAEPEKKQRPLEELILEEPEEAVLQVVRKHFGGDLSRIDSSVSSALKASLRAELEDFKDLEDDIDRIITENKLPPSRENMLGAYTMAVGMKAIEQKRQSKQAESNIDRGDPPPAEKDKVKEPEGLEREVMLAHNMTADEWNRYKNNEFEIRVPTGERKAANNG